MLTDVPMKLGRAAKSTIADLVYAILTSNPKISTDNVSLFDKAKHANVLESAAMDVASLDKARQLMRVQKEGGASSEYSSCVRTGTDGDGVCC